MNIYDEDGNLIDDVEFRKPDFSGKRHASDTQNVWIAGQMTSALRTIYHAVPMRNSAVLEELFERARQCVLGECSLEVAERELIESLKKLQ